MTGDIRREVNRFNLTFSGEILAGHDPAQVRLRFARMFSIDDPARLERFFSGETVILRRNLERKAAAQCYHELHLMGALAALVKVADDAPDAAEPPPQPTKPANTPKQSTRKKPAKSPVRPPPARARDKTWAVSTAVKKHAANGNTVSTPTAATHHSGADSGLAAVDIAAAVKARKLEAQRQAAEQAARERAALAEQQRKAAEDAARQQAEALERQRLAAEETARLEAERKRRAEEEAAKREAIAAETQRIAAEEAARKRAIKEEARRKAAEEELKRKAERRQRKIEQAQRKAEEAARRKAEQDEKKRRDAEEAARRKAELEEKKRQEAEEAARRKAALEEKKRQEAEEAARRAAALEEKRRQEAEAAARRKAALEEQKRREAQEAARRKAAQEEQQRREAQEAARRKAELDELKRREAEEDARLQAELAAIKRREAEEAERLQAELEEQARQAAAHAAQIRAEAQRQEREAQRQSAERRRAIAEALAARQARQAEKQRARNTALATQVAQDSQPLLPLEPELPRPATGKRAKARIRTALDVPPRKPGQDAPAPEPRRRQPGEPNLYKLRPFRNTDDVRQRATVARRRMRRSYALGVVALAALLIVAGAFTQRTTSPLIPGARAVAVDPRSGPLLLAGDSLLLHDRAGLGTLAQPLSALGLDAMAPPLAFDEGGALFARGRLTGAEPSPAAGQAGQLLRCEAPLSQCKPFSPELQDSSIDAFVINPVDGSLLLGDRSVGLLLKTDRDGVITARADVLFPEQLVLRLHSGLLLMNSATGPAISVLRYENNAFGQQLDEILVLPPGAQQAEDLSVGDFVWSGQHWWVSLYNPDSGRTGLYRYDEEWNFIDQVSLPTMSRASQLVNWGQKTLVNDPQQLAIQRISAQGVVEAPFVSAQLEKVSAEMQWRASLTTLAWRGALAACALGVLLGFGYGYLQSRRALVYQPRREQGAEPLDEHIDALHWIDPVANRPSLLRRRIASYCLLALGVLLLAVAQSVGVWQLCALLLALSGPAIALLLLSRQGTGHIGILGDRLLLVDHNGTYHLAGGSRVQYHGPFLSIDDVVVFCGSHLLPVFSTAQVQKLVKPLSHGGIKVDRDTVSVKLLQSRHPLAIGALAIAAALAAAILVLYLQG